MAEELDGVDRVIAFGSIVLGAVLVLLLLTHVNRNAALAPEGAGPALIAALDAGWRPSR